MSTEHKVFRAEQMAEDLRGCGFAIMLLAVIAALIVGISAAVFAFKGN